MRVWARSDEELVLATGERTPREQFGFTGQPVSSGTNAHGKFVILVHVVHAYKSHEYFMELFL